MRKIKKMPKLILLSALSAIAFGGIAAGSTYALFTSSAETKTTVTAGKVDVSATLTELTAHSYENISLSTFVGTKVERTDGTFLTGGTYEYNETENALTLNRVVPGDGVDFKIKTTNKSNVATKYRVVIKTISDDGLLNALSVKVDGTDYQAEDWGYTSLQPLQAIDDIAVSIELPLTASNDYQDKTFKFAVTLEAVQGNADTSRSYALYDDGKSYIINLHGENKFNMAGYLVYGNTDTKVTINGDGKVIVTPKNGCAQAVWANKGTVIINGGEYTQDISSDDTEAYSVVYASGGGIVIINGGTFKAGNSATEKYLLNCQDNTESKIVINGGKFFNFDPSNLPTKVQNDNISISEGYKVTSSESDGGIWYEVVQA